jgi:methylenetetrahydrofolate dehydrogenase (NADP+)/methenyltetrahydrofolate cyclohydrolase
VPIDGKVIANGILENLIHDLKNTQVVPTMAVILISDDPASLSYIKQKQKAADVIGAKVQLHQLPATTTTEELRTLIQKLNNDKGIHGIIIQRPLPPESPIDRKVLLEVSPKKDIDGFVPNSPYSVPVALAVSKILEEIYLMETNESIVEGNPEKIPADYLVWLRSKKIAVIGRGETAGKPITEMFIKDGCKVDIVHSKTNNPDEVIRSADIVVSCVGQDNIVRHDNIKPKSILISVGLWRDSVGKLHGDYEEEDIKDIANYYTPTPGGVGPVNVACLMENLVKSATINKGG